MLVSARKHSKSETTRTSPTVSRKRKLSSTSTLSAEGPSEPAAPPTKRKARSKSRETLHPPRSGVAASLRSNSQASVIPGLPYYPEFVLNRKNRSRSRSKSKDTKDKDSRESKDSKDSEKESKEKTSGKKSHKDSQSAVDFPCTSATPGPSTSGKKRKGKKSRKEGTVSDITRKDMAFNLKTAEELSSCSGHAVSSEVNKCCLW